MRSLLLREEVRGEWKGKERVGDGGRRGERGRNGSEEMGAGSLRLNRAASYLTPAL